jgi:hypothetical protein
MENTFLEKLKNILICYSTRNTSVGYCQGMNFIGGRLLLIMGNEEQAFWLFIEIMEKILPVIYYSELVGIVVETFAGIFELYFHEVGDVGVAGDIGKVVVHVELAALSRTAEVREAAVGEEDRLCPALLLFEGGCGSGGGFILLLVHIH